MGKNKKTIKIDLLDKFREMESEVDNTLPRGWLRKDYLAGLNRFEKEMFDTAVSELVANGLVEYAPGIFPKVTLTRKGEHLIHRVG